MTTAITSENDVRITVNVGPQVSSKVVTFTAKDGFQVTAVLLPGDLEVLRALLK